MRPYSPVRRSLWGAALLWPFLAGAGLPQEAGPLPPVDTVVVSNNGVASYGRTVPASALEDGAEILSIPLPLDAIDGALQSLLVTGPTIEGAEMRLPTADAQDRVFSRLPFAPSDLSRMETVLARLPGVEVSVAMVDGYDAAGAPIQVERRGRVVGVDTGDVCGPEEVCAPVLLIQEEGGTLRRVTLWDDSTRVSIEDAEASAALDQAVAALSAGAKAHSRALELRLRAAPGGDARVAMVLPAPGWKAAYRASLAAEGGVEVQAWAVVSNVSQEDWTGVRLALVSGSAQVLDADLYGSTGLPKEGSQANRGLVMERAIMDAALESSADGMMALAAPAPAAEMGGVGGWAPGTQTAQGEEGARFTIDTPVDLPAGSVLSLPFLVGGWDASVVAHHTGYEGAGPWARDGAAPDFVPMATALDLENTSGLRLPDGILSLHEEGKGFVGDAFLPAMEPESVHMIPVRSTSGVEVAQGFEERMGRLRVQSGEGWMRTTRVLERTTRYTLRNVGGTARRGVVDHPQPDASVEASAEGTFEALGRGDGMQVWRFALDLEPGAEQAVSVTTRMPIEESWSIGDVREEQLAAWSGEAADEATAAWLREAAALARASTDAERAWNLSDEERGRLVTDQDRRARMAEALDPQSPAYTRFAEEMMAAEDAIAVADAERESLRMAWESARTAFAGHLSTAP